MLIVLLENVLVLAQGMDFTIHVNISHYITMINTIFDVPVKIWDAY